MNTNIQNALKIIGDSTDDDCRLTPSALTGRYQETAPDLITLLKQTQAETSSTRYEISNKKAIERQYRYKACMSRASIAVLTTSTLGACAMALQILLPDKPLLISSAGMLAAISGASAGYWLHQVKHEKLLENWMQSRAAAETARLDYFTSIAQSASVSTNPVLPILSLEFIRRYLLDMQIRYYTTREQDHRISATRTIRIGGLGVGLTVFSGTGAFSDIRIFGVLAIIGAAISAYSIAREQYLQDNRNAERYDRSLSTLTIFKSKLDHVRNAVAQGNRQALTDFSEALCNHLSLEHRQWLETGEGATSALKRLEETLKKPRDPNLNQR